MPSLLPMDITYNCCELKAKRQVQNTKKLKRLPSKTQRDSLEKVCKRIDRECKNQKKNLSVSNIATSQTVGLF